MFFYLQNKDSQLNPLPKPLISTFERQNANLFTFLHCSPSPSSKTKTHNQTRSPNHHSPPLWHEINFFLRIGKSTNLFVTKRKGELNRADGSLSLFLSKIKLNGFWSLFFLYFITKYYIFIIKNVVFEQAQQLFQRDAQTITPEALESVKAALASSEIEHKAETKKKVVPSKAAGQAWEDPTLADWPKSMNYFSLLLFTMCWYLIYMILRPDLLIYNGCRLIFIPSLTHVILL